MSPHLVSQTELAIALDRGDGCRIVDAAGRSYLDFGGGWCVSAIGWNHPAVRRALEREILRGTYAPPYLRFPAWEEFAALLSRVSPGSLHAVYPVTSGSEAVDMAVKLARAATKKTTILSIGSVYHGHTYGAASAGEAGARIAGPLVPGFRHLPLPGPEASADAVLTAIRAELRSGDVAAFLSEPVWTNTGAHVPPPDFYPEVQRLCGEAGSLLIMDEVATGFAHCGRLFASELWGLSPDILCLGKAFTGGYATMGATLATKDVADRAAGIPCYSTFAWLPMDFAATRANVETLLELKVWENAARVGARLLDLLRPLAASTAVRDVRGIGLILGVEIAADAREAYAVQRRCADRGLIVNVAGSTLFLSPPCTLTEGEAEEGAGMLAEVLEN